jgi:hypothetical protein
MLKLFVERGILFKNGKLFADGQSVGRKGRLSILVVRDNLVSVLIIKLLVRTILEDRSRLIHNPF